MQTVCTVVRMLEMPYRSTLSELHRLSQAGIGLEEMRQREVNIGNA